MSQEYLWDKTGPADIEVIRLEEALRPLRFEPGRKRRADAGRVAMVAAVVVAAIGLSATTPALSEWEVNGRRTTTGEVVRAGVPLRIEAESTGVVDLAAGSELQIGTRRSLRLLQGTMHAFVWAPPAEFSVETRSARAVDLGCEYTLQVDAAGNGDLHVSTGWVAFEYRGIESFIPAGAACTTSAGKGPGLPYFEDASARFRSAAVGESLEGLLSEARPRDALTLWHVMERSPADRGRVFDKLAALVPAVGAIDRGAVIRGEPEALDGCWNALGLESADWWRQWRRRW